MQDGHFCVRRGFSEIAWAVSAQGGCPGFSSWIWPIFGLTLSYEKSGISLGSESDQEMCLQVSLLKICLSFPPRKEALSRNRLCGACTEQKAWGRNLWSIPQLRVGQAQHWAHGSLRVWTGETAQRVEEEFSTCKLVWLEEWHSGVVVSRWSPAPSQVKPFFHAAPVELIQDHGSAFRGTERAQGSAGSIAFHFSTSQELQDGAHGFQFILWTITSRIALNYVDK